MKTAIVIQHNAHTGKSATVVAIYNELLRLGAILIKDSTEESFKVTRGEVNAIVEYKGKKIGIQSKGDPPELELATGALNSFVEHHCTVIISASRRQNTPTAATKTQIIDLLRGAGYQTIETSQYQLAHSHGVLSNGVDVNKQYAQAIADLVDSVV